MLTVEFPFADGSGSKVRPVVVIQSDRVKLLGIVIAGISSSPQRDKREVGAPSRAGKKTLLCSL